MLIIKDHQIKTFEEAALRQFEDQMLIHLQQFSPPLIKTLEETQVRTAIQFGINQARKHGFTLHGPIRFYLELMLLFGSYFDTDPQYPWIREILEDQDAGSEMQRAERLYEKTMEYQEIVGGPDDSYAIASLRRLDMFARQPISIPSDNFIPGLLHELGQIYPEKARYIGTQGLTAVIHKGVQGAKSQQFTSVRSVVLVCLLMLAFGHGCGADPLYPWIARTLTDKEATDAEAKALRLEKRTLTWLNHVLAHFDGKEASA